MVESRARRTVRPPKPESKTPMMGRCGVAGFESCIELLAAGGGISRGVSAEEVGVAGEGFAGLAIDEEADLLDLREVGVERADHGEQGEVFDFDAGGMLADEAAAEIDDGELAAGGGGLGGVGVVGGDGNGGGVAVGVGCSVGVDGVADDGKREEEDLVDGGTGLERVCGAGEGVLGDEVVEKSAGAGGGLGGKGDVAGLSGDGAVVVVGEEEGDGLFVGVGGVKGRGVGEALDASAALLAMGEELDAHADDGGDHDPEDDARGADAHGVVASAVVGSGSGGARCGGGLTASFQRMRALAAACAMDCWYESSLMESGSSVRGASSKTSAGQAVESTGRMEAEPLTSGMRERLRASAMLPARCCDCVTQGAWRVSQGAAEGSPGAGVSSEVERWTPLPEEV